MLPRAQGACGRLLACTVIAAFLVAAWGGAARAQGWGLTRSRRHPPARQHRPRRAPHPRRTPEAADRRTVLIDRYLRILSARPDEAMAWERLLELVRERDGDLGRLTLDLESRASSDDAPYADLFLRARLAEEQRDADSAAAYYRRAAAREPSSPAPLLALARLAHAAGDRPGAARLLEASLPKIHDAARTRDALRRLGDLALEDGDLERARGWYDRVTPDRGAGAFARAEFARALARHGRHSEAAEAYAELARRMRGDRRVLAPLRLELAREQLAAGETAAAIATARALLGTTRGGTRAEVLALLEEAHRRAGSLGELTEELRREAGRNADLWAMVGRLADEGGDTDPAAQAYTRALALAPRDLDTRERLVQLWVRAGRLEDAIREARVLWSHAAGEPRFLASWVHLLVQSGRPEDALREVGRAVRGRPRDLALLRAAAEIYDELGEAERATAALERLLRLAPRDPEAVVALGTRRLGEGDRAGALRLFRRLGGQGGGYAGHLTLGRVLADHDLLREAETELREALRLAPGELEVVRALASLLERERGRESPDRRSAREDESAELWRRVLTLAGDEAGRREAREHIVLTTVRAGRGRAQLQRWRQQFSADPPDLDAGRYLASALLRQRPPQRREAAATLEAVLGHAPGDLGSLRELERVYTLMGDREGAIRTLRRLVDADPRRAAAYLGRMVDHAHALYRDEDALTWAAEAARRSPRDAQAQRRLGELLRSRQDMAGAADAFERALALDPRLSSIRLELAELLLALGRPADADQQLAWIIRNSADDDRVVAAIQSSTRIHAAAGTLPELSRLLLPLAVAQPRRVLFRRVLVELYAREAAPWLSALDTPGPARERALVSLEALGARALSPLLAALADGDPAQRDAALSLLGHLGRHEAVAPLLALAEREGSLSIRRRALLAAAPLLAAPDAPRLISLARGPERRLRPLALLALAGLSGRRVDVALRSALGDSDVATRVVAELAAGSRLDVRALGPLTQTLVRRRASVELAPAAWAIGRILRAPSLRASSAEREAAIAALRPLLTSRSVEVAGQAAIALTSVDPEDQLSRLAALLFSPALASRRAAARGLVLAELGPSRPRALPSLSPRASVFDHLAALSTPVAWPPELAQARRRALLAAAREGLSGTDAQAAVVLAALEDPGQAASREIAGAAARTALAEELDLAAELAESVAALAEREAPSIRLAAWRVLARQPRVDLATRALVDPEPEVRHLALGALSELDEVAPDVAERVVASFLDSPEWPERVRGAQALGRWRAPNAITPLIERLESDRYAFVREAAAQALRGYDDPRAEEALRRAALEDAEPRVRAAAAVPAGP